MKKSFVLLGFVWSISSLAADVSVQPFGFIETSWIAASGGAETFSQPNLGAYTAAGNPAMNPRHAETVSSFQVAQSRLGFNVKAPEDTQGTLEFDFIDFSKSSPTTAALPRLRRAFMDYKHEDWTYRFGQDWDIVSPLAPHSFNWVGHYFQSGDVAFMRIQAEAIHQSVGHEEAYAIGLPGNNNNAAVGQLEATLFPTLAYRQTWKHEKDQCGFSILGSALGTAAATRTYFFAGVLNGFVQHFYEDQSEIRAEIYVGRNTANIGLLGLSYGNGKNLDTGDYGIYATYKKPVGTNSFWFSGVGYAHMMDPNNMAASTVKTVAGTSLAGTGPGIESNLTVRTGLGKNVTQQFQLFAELAYFETQHHLDPLDVGSFQAFNRVLITEVGTQLTF